MDSIEYSFMYTRNDIKKLLIYVYKKYIYILVTVFFASNIFGLIDYIINSRKLLNIQYFIDWIVPFLVFLSLIIYLYIVLMRRYFGDPRIKERKRLKIDEVGIEIASENALVRILWNEISKIERKEEIVFVRYNRTKVLCIPDYSDKIDIEKCKKRINLTIAST